MLSNQSLNCIMYADGLLVLIRGVANCTHGRTCAPEIKQNE